jgi:hypothetical protein
MPFLYGNHVLKAHLGRITEDTPEHQGVVVFSLNDVALVLFSFLFSCTHTDRFCFRDLVLLPGQRSTHVNWILQPSSCFIKRTPSAQSSLSSLLILSARDIGEYLRDEVLATCSPPVQVLTHFSGNALLNCLCSSMSRRSSATYLFR